MTFPNGQQFSLGPQWTYFGDNNVTVSLRSNAAASLSINDANPLPANLNLTTMNLQLMFPNAFLAALTFPPSVVPFNDNTQVPANIPTAFNTLPPTTLVTVGTGNLASIQGAVSITAAQVAVNDSAATAAQILTLTGTSLTGWQPANGAGSPSLTFADLYGTLAITGGAADQFDVEDTPVTVQSTDITNPAATAAQDVYVMGDAFPLDVTGDFVVYIGRRLNADGSVDDVGQVDALESPVQFDYTGPGITQLYLDESNDAALAGLATPLFSKVSYGANVEFFAYLAPQAFAEFGSDSTEPIYIFDTNPPNAQGQGQASTMRLRLAPCTSRATAARASKSPATRFSPTFTSPTLP